MDFKVGIGGNTDVAQNYRGLLLAKITAVNIPVGGPFNTRPVYDWEEQAFNSQTGDSEYAYGGRKGVYTGPYEFQNCLVDANDASLGIGSYLWIRMKGAIAGQTVYESAFGGGSVKSYIVRLTDEGVGIDGGTAWNGYVQYDNAGVIQDDFLLADDLPYVLYATRAENGAVGFPEINDRVVAIPDPELPGRWLFIPKKPGESCNDCCWLIGLPLTTCLAMEGLGGQGACECVPVTSKAVAKYVDRLSGWLAARMGKTCCGCGGMLLTINDDPADCEAAATLTLRNYHVACDGASGTGGGIFSMNLFVSCCGKDDVTGKPNVVFVGYGPDPCNDDAGPCGNVFRIKVTCDDCPAPICGCCCETVSPSGWFEDVTDFDDDHLNGTWVWEFDPDAEVCTWRAECYGITSTLYYDPDAAVFRLDHDGFLYELSIDSWVCHGDNELMYVSGGSGGHATAITIRPIGRFLDLVDPCTLPDSLTVSLSSAGCAIFNGDFTVTRSGPGPWQFSNLGEGDRVTNVGLLCEAGAWSVSATAQCVTDDVPYAFELHTTATPDLEQFGPLEIVWDSVDITGDDPSHVPDCCVVSTATVTVTE